jgi:DNA-binding transcriptional LysR family regulator
MVDRLESMSILLAAVGAGSLSGAARRLGMPLPTVSRKVSELEGYLRTRLLIRSNRRLALTEAGSAYVAACKRILDDVDEAERAAMGEYSAPKGDLTVTAPIVFGRLHVLPVVADFLEAYPDIDIRLVLADSLINLIDDRIDLAVRIGELPDSSLVATRVGAIRRVTCGSPVYFAARGKPREPGDLAVHDCLTCEGLTSAKVWTFTKGKSDLPVTIRSRLIVNAAEAAIDAAIAGLGITRVLSYQIAKARRAGTLDTVLEAFEPAPWPVSLVYPDQAFLPVKLRAFIDFAAPRLKARLAPAAP